MTIVNKFPNYNKPQIIIKRYPYQDTILGNRREEEWVDIIGYEGLYMISNHGRIKSLEKEKYFVKLKLKIDTGIHKQRKNKKGNHLTVSLCKNSLVRTFTVSKLVLASFNKDITMLTKRITYVDKDPLNNRLENLKIFI